MYGPEDSGDLSLRDACLGEPRRTDKGSFISGNVDSRCTGDNGKGMNEGHKEATKIKCQESPLCCIDGHPPHPKARTSRRILWEQSQVWKLSSPGESCTRISREDRWSRYEGRKFKLGQSFTKRSTVVMNEKLREWIQNHPPVQVPSLNISEHLIWISTNRELWTTVHHCAKKEKTSIICVANLHSLREWLTRFEQRWHEDESSSVHRETVAFTMGG